MTGKARGGLGRGLAALIPTGPTTTTVADVLINGSPARREQAAAVPGQPAVGARQTDSRRPGRRSSRAERRRFDYITVRCDDRTAPRYVDVPIDDIRRNPRNPRTVFDEEALVELTHSIREFGLLQPIVVRDVAGGGYELVMGERRWRAAQRAGLTTIPAIVRRTEDADCSGTRCWRTSTGRT